MEKKLKNMSQVKKFKLYKSKSQWVVATMAFATLGLGATMTTAQAETKDSSEPVSQVQKQPGNGPTVTDNAATANQPADASQAVTQAPTQKATEPQQGQPDSALTGQSATEAKVDQNAANRGDTYHLGNADTTAIEATKKAAALTYQQTRRPQTVTAVKPTTSDTITWGADHEGNVTISGGTIDDHTRYINSSENQDQFSYDPSQAKSITIQDDLKVIGDASNLFSNMARVKTINGLDKLNTSSITNMHHLFANDSALTELDLSAFNFDGLKNAFKESVDSQFAHMLDGTTGLTKITVNAFTPGTKNGATTGLALVSHATDPIPAVWQDEATGETLDVNHPVTKPNVAATYVLTPIKQPTKDVITPKNETIVSGNPTPAFTAVSSGTDLKGLTFTNHDFYFVASDDKVSKTMPTAAGVYEIHLNAGAVERISQNNPNYLVTFKNFGTGTFTIKQKASAIVSFYDQEGQQALPGKYNQTVTGVVGENPYAVITLPANYELTDDHPGIRVYQNGTIKYDREITDDATDNIQINLNHHHTIGTTRSVDTINLTGLPKPKKLQAEISWQTDKDEVTQQTTYSPEKTTINAPKIVGYTPESQIIPLEKTRNQVPEDRTFDIAYTPNTVTANVKIPSNGGPQTVKGVTGRTGEHLQVAVPKLPGYIADKQTVSATVNPDGTITVDPLHRWKGDPNYVSYSLADQTITVRFVKEKGKFLGKTVITGKTWQKVDYGAAHAKEQEIINTGYTPKTGLQNGLVGAPAKFTTHAQTFNVQLTKIKNVKVTTTLVPSDTAGNPLPNTTSTTVHEFPGTSVKVPDVPGYTPVNETVTIPGDRTQTLKIAYTANRVTADVIIPSNLGDQTMLGVTGKIGDQLQLEVPNISGYTADKSRVSATVNPNGTITIDGPAAKSGDNGYVTYIADDQSITVRFLDERGEELGNVLLTGKTWQKVEYEAAFAKEQELINTGYTPKTGLHNGLAGAPVKFTIHTQTANVQLAQIKNVKVTTRLVPSDTKGNPLPNTTPTAVHDYPGTSVKAPVIPGYTAVHETVTIPSDRTQTIKIIYTANQVTADVPIPSNLGDQTILGVTGKTGDQLQLEVPNISGYTADKPTVSATVNPDGTITVDPPKDKLGDQNYVTYTPAVNNEPGQVGTPSDAGSPLTTTEDRGTGMPAATIGGHGVRDAGMPISAPEAHGTGIPISTDANQDTEILPAAGGTANPMAHHASVASQTTNLSAVTNQAAGATGQEQPATTASRTDNPKQALTATDGTHQAMAKLPQTNEAAVNVWALLGMGLMSGLALSGITKRKKHEESD